MKNTIKAWTPAKMKEDSKKAVAASTRPFKLPLPCSAAYNALKIEKKCNYNAQCRILPKLTILFTKNAKRRTELLPWLLFAKSNFFIIRDMIFLLNNQITALAIGVIVTLKVFS